MKKKYVILFICCLLFFAFCPALNIVKADSLTLDICSTNTPITTFTSFSTINNRDFVFLDKYNKQVIVTNATQTNTISATSNKDESFVTPIYAIQTYQKKFYVIDTVNDAIGRLIVYDSSLNFESLQYLVEKNQTQTITLGTDIPSTCIDFYDNAYILDKTNSTIVKYSKDNMKLSYLYAISTFVLDNYSTIKCSISGDILCVSSQNKILAINSGISSEITTNYTITDFAIDCSGNLFVLDNSNQNSCIHKISLQSSQEISTTNLDNLYNNIFIEQENGKLYLINNNLYTLYISDYVTNLLTFEPPIDYEKNESIQNNAIIAKTLDDVDFLSNPYSLTKDIIINKDTKIIILSEEVENSPSFAYCLYENNTSRQLGYIKKTQYEKIDCSQQEQEKITYSKTILYKYPTTNSTQLDVVEKNTTYTATLVDTYTDKNGNQFYMVNAGGKIAYIKTSALIQTDLFEPQATIQEYTYPIDEPIAFILIIVSISLLFAISIYIIKNKIPN